MTTAPEVDPGRMTLVDHLTELRSRLIKVALAVGLGAVICWIAYPVIINFLTEPYQQLCEDGKAVVTDPADRSCALLVTDPLEPFNVRLTVAGYGGIALAMPVILWQLWKFVAPGLYPHERRNGLIFVVAGVILFILGASLAFWSLPRALDFLASVGGEDLVSFFSPARYLNFVVKMMMAFGIGFLFPIMLILLQITGLVETRTLSQNRRYAVLGIVVLTAVITPSGDPFTLAVLTIPLYLFYEFSILFGRLRSRRLAKAASTPTT